MIVLINVRYMKFVFILQFIMSFMPIVSVINVTIANVNMYNNTGLVNIVRKNSLTLALSPFQKHFLIERQYITAIANTVTESNISTNKIKISFILSIDIQSCRFDIHYIYQSGKRENIHYSFRNFYDFHGALLPHSFSR